MTTRIDVTRAKNVARWAAYSGGVLALTVYGGLHDAQWARNIVTLVVWLSVPTGVLVIAGLTYVSAQLGGVAAEVSDESVAEIVECARKYTGPPVPTGLFGFVAAITLLLFAGLGWFWAATGYVLALVVCVFAVGALKVVRKQVEALR